MNNTVFTSESVSEGHPDKICDQISDAVLDALLSQDKDSRVACETLVKSGMVFIAGEIRTQAWVDIEELARSVIRDIGYNTPEIGFDSETCAVVNAIGKQSADIAQGVDENTDKPIAAGDQGLMFGYACNETDVYMPAPITYSHRLMQQQALLRKNGQLPWLRPDAKAQLSFRYENQKPVAIEAIVLSTQHAPDIDQKTLDNCDVHK